MMTSKSFALLGEIENKVSPALLFAILPNLGKDIVGDEGGIVEHVGTSISH